MRLNPPSLFIFSISLLLAGLALISKFGAIGINVPRYLPHQEFWRHLLSDAGGFVIGGAGASKAGDGIELKLSEPATVRAGVEVLVGGQGLALRIHELTDALLFVELEGKKDKFHVGYWLSVYDETQAKALEAPAKRAFRRIHESIPT